MLTLFRVLESYGVETDSIKLVRHGNKEIPILETFRHNRTRFEAYQSYQLPGRFDSAASIAVFAPYQNTTALFLGLWRIRDCIKNTSFSEENRNEIASFSLPASWYEDLDKYVLEWNPVVDELSERLVIEWGGATVAWVQKKDKPVVELRRQSSIFDFRSYDSVALGFQDLTRISRFPQSNEVWITALSAVNGVYLITNTTDGKQYVGSAYGEKGIWGRWSNYAQSGHGGNKELKELDPLYFRFSILEVVPPTMTQDGVIQRENLWKEKLGTRKFGLNQN